MPGPPPLATPLDWQFWTFFVSQLARALGDRAFDSDALTRAVLLNIFVFAVVIAAMARCTLRIANGSHRPRDLHYLVIAAGILMPLLGYLAVVSAGRGNFQAHDTVPGLVLMAKSRFHYWWLVGNGNCKIGTIAATVIVVYADVHGILSIIARINMSDRNGTASRIDGIKGAAITPIHCDGVGVKTVAPPSQSSRGAIRELVGGAIQVESGRHQPLSARL